MDTYDVAIVGYGPTGMVLAGLLGKMGHRVVILERYEGLYNLPRAACFDDETMRSFQKLGIADGIGAGSVVQDDYEWVNAAGETLVRLEYDREAPGGWAAMHMMYQPDVEAVLDDLIGSLETVELRRSVTVDAVGAGPDSVTLGGTGPGGRRVNVRARYAVGADGGNGFMRSQVAGAMDDLGFQENWLVCDFRMKRQVEGLPMFRQICNPDQPRSIVRIGPDNHRFSFMLDPGVSAEEATDAAGVWTRVADFIGPEDAELIRVANYVFRSRVADRWQAGRVFLAGDAAHEMPPFLGQGMCSGIRDAENLAWKFDHVLRGGAAGVLDSYQPEREPHVRFITGRAIELGRVQTLRDPEAARRRDEQMLAQRRARKRPDKITLPGLTSGLVANDGGYFPQATLRSGGQRRKFDELAGTGWLLVHYGPPLCDALGDAQRALIDRLGVQVVPLTQAGRDGPAEDVTGAYGGWFANRACLAAMIRPDRYVYGTAADGAALRSLLSQLETDLGLAEPPQQLALRG